nr:hypothetical transcript [Hymenolepis microstoma]
MSKTSAANFESEVISPGSSLTEVSSSKNSLSTSLGSEEEHKQSNETESVAFPIRYSPVQSILESETEFDGNNYPPEGMIILGVTKNDEQVFLRIRRKDAHREE